MKKNKYNLRHVRCSMADFNADRHRFRFTFEKKEYLVACYGAWRIEMDPETEKVPGKVLLEIQDMIWKKFDDGEEKNWRYPEAAHKVADAYFEEHFYPRRLAY